MNFLEWRSLPEDKRPTFNDVQPDGESRFDGMRNPPARRLPRKRSYKERYRNARVPERDHLQRQANDKD
jgi:hypothetical protein